MDGDLSHFHINAYGNLFPILCNHPCGKFGIPDGHRSKNHAPCAGFQVSADRFLCPYATTDFNAHLSLDKFPHDTVVFGLSKLCTIQVNGMHILSTTCSKILKDLLWLPGIHGLFFIVAPFKTNDLTLTDINCRKNDHALPHILQKFLSILSPTFPLFSGWN